MPHIGSKGYERYIYLVDIVDVLLNPGMEEPSANKLETYRQ